MPEDIEKKFDPVILIQNQSLLTKNLKGTETYTSAVGVILFSHTKYAVKSKRRFVGIARFLANLV